MPLRIKCTEITLYSLQASLDFGEVVIVWYQSYTLEGFHWKTDRTDRVIIIALFKVAVYHI